MSKSTRIGKVKVAARVRERETPKVVEEEIAEKNPKQDLLNKYGLQAKDFEDLSNIEFTELLYSLETYGVKQTLDSLKSKEPTKQKLPSYAGPTLPYVELLEAKRLEYEYLINFNPKASINLQDCRISNCRAKTSVTFVSSINYRADESYVQKFRCQVCGQYQ